jgi:hypothetical protein
MEGIVIGGLLTLAGVVVKAVIDLVADSRSASGAKAARRFDVEYDSLRELSELMSALRTPSSPAGLEATKVRAVALAHRVRDPRPAQAVEQLIVQEAGSDAWNDEVGNAARVVGQSMRELV